MNVVNGFFLWYLLIYGAVQRFFISIYRPILGDVQNESCGSKPRKYEMVAQALATTQKFARVSQSLNETQ